MNNREIYVQTNWKKGNWFKNCEKGIISMQQLLDISLNDEEADNYPIYEQTNELNRKSFNYGKQSKK